MAISVQWDNPEKTAVAIVYQRPWTWQEFDSAVGQMLALFNTVNHQVDVIFDIRSGGFPPPDAIRRFKKVAGIQHANGGLLVFIAPTGLVRFINSMVTIITRAFQGSGSFEAPNFVFTKSPEEAHAYLLKKRAAKTV